VIELTIAGAKHRFIIDTGATHSLFTSDFATTFKFKNHYLSAAKGIGSDIVDILRVDLQFNFCGVTIYSVALTNRMKHIKMSLPFEVSGLIGQDILSQFSQVCFDYKNKVVRFVG